MNLTASELSSPTLKPSDYDSIDRIAKSKLKSFFHKSDSSTIPHEETDFEDTSSSADLGLQEDIVSDVYDVKNVNPLVEKFVAKRMKIKSRLNSMVRFGSNRTKIFDKESILQVPKKEPPRLTPRDSILVVKEQNPQYLEAVSYTHLDVYKRQVRTSVRTKTLNFFLIQRPFEPRSNLQHFYFFPQFLFSFFFSFFNCLTPHFFPNILQDPASIIAVSYTHLDVYKRQT